MKPFLGIDFGTTNSSVAYVYDDPRHRQAQSIHVNLVDITMDEEHNLTVPRMPTLVSSRFDDRRAKGELVGWEVSSCLLRKKQTPLVRRGQELFESVKSDLGSNRVYPYAKAQGCQTPLDVAAKIFRALLAETQRKLGRFGVASVRTVITVPASLNADARRETREAAVAAGLSADLVELIDEPIAALLHLLNDQTAASVLSIGEPRNVMVFDYGGGTLDLCLVKCVFSPESDTGLRAENLRHLQLSPQWWQRC